MRTKHLIAESILIIITLVFAVMAVIHEDGGLGFALWWQVLGVSQVVHSILIGILYRKDEQVLKWLSVYWITVPIDLLLLAIAPNLVFGIIVFIVIPSILALYLWYITWHFRRRGEIGMNF
jgi:hypothetical protein